MRKFTKAAAMLCAAAMVICVLIDSLNAMRQTKIAAGEKDVQDGGAA